MPNYDVLRAQAAVVEHCKHWAPRLPLMLAGRLQGDVPGFYPNSKPEGAVRQLKKHVLSPLVAQGLLIRYTPESEAWEEVKRAVSLGSVGGAKRPRKITEAYQTHFLYLGGNSVVGVRSLPAPPHRMNLHLVTMLSKFAQPEKFTWEMLNLLLCASDKRIRDGLRLHLYILPLDYKEVVLLENLLEHGEEYGDISFPFKPDVDEAKGFLARLAGE